MRANQSFKSHSDRKELVVTALALEMRRIVQRAASPVQPGETIKAQQRRAWEALKRPPFWRLRAAWYGEAGSWSAVAADDLRRRDAERRRKAEALDANRTEAVAALRALRARYAELDPEFFGEQMVALEQAISRAGG